MVMIKVIIFKENVSRQAKIKFAQFGHYLLDPKVKHLHMRWIKIAIDYLH